MPAENPSDPQPATTTELTQTQATLLSHLLHEIRPDWGIPSMMRLLWDNRTHAPFPALVEAAVKTARNPEKRTPAVIFMDGKHWLTGEQERNPAYTSAIGNDPDCPEHPGNTFSSCRVCAKAKTPMPTNFRDMIRAATEGETPA